MSTPEQDEKKQDNKNEQAFLVTEDGKFITTEDGKFIVVDQPKKEEESNKESE